MDEETHARGLGMSRTGTRTVIANLLALAALGCASTATTAGPGAPGASPPHWEYAENAEAGPAGWGGLDGGAYRTCKVGTQQSPIDIPAGVAPRPLTAVGVFYAPAQATVVDNGHSVQFTFTGGTNKVTMNGKDYTLQQFHFHRPSEHTVAGKRYPLEVHLVHKDSADHLVVLGTLFETGAAENAGLGAIFDSLAQATATPTPVATAVDPAALLPTDRSGWTYRGSLTTPPCTEGVAWLVYAHPVTVSAAQVEKFHHEPSSRPVQPLLGRTVNGGS
jgi:carbonic anhydrase